MKGHDQIIEVLNDVLSAELTAINQYFLHGKMCQNWGYDRLHSKIRAESIDEMKHADELMARVLYLEGLPNVQRLYKINIGQTVKEMLALDLEVERVAWKRLNDGIEVCRSLGDNGSRELLERILVSEEQHIDWLEAQLEQIKQIGEANYLAQQVRG